MFHRLASWCAVLLCGAVLLGASSLRAQGIKPLLPNGDFETDANADSIPDGWKAGNGLSFDKDDGGNHFLRIKSEQPGKMVMVYRLFDMKPEYKALEFSYRVRYEGIKVGEKGWFDGRIMINFKDKEGKVLKGGPGAPNYKGTSKEWQAKTMKFNVPEGAKTLEIMPCLFNVAAGTIDFDDLKLVVLDDNAATDVKAAADAAAEKKAAKTAEANKKADAKIAAQASATGGNLLSNGDFATPNKTGDFPADWGHAKEGSGVTWEQENGKHFLRLVQTDPGEVKMAYRIIPLPTGIKGIEVTIRYRTADVVRGTKMPGDARAIFHFLDGDRGGHMEMGNQVNPDPGAIGFSAKATDWTEATHRSLVPEAATKLQIMPGLWFTKAGKVDLAEIRVTAMSDADALAMADEKASADKKKTERAALIEQELARPAITPELKVKGRDLLTADGKSVWLQGVCVDSMQWGPGDNILWSIRVAIDEWHANVIRLPLHDKLWFGQQFKTMPAGNPDRYRKIVDDAAKLCAGKGAYLVIDLHQFGAPMPEHADFWKDVAARYKNDPAVIFELFNEPHDIPWTIWRDGGDLSKAKHDDNAVVENTDKNTGKMSVGMQALVDAVRGTGARNIIVAGGLGWSYDLSGLLQGYALKDSADGDGIVYAHHNYPWKSGWQKALLDVVDKYPVLVSEVGCPEKWEDFSFIKVNERSEKLGPGCTWPNDMLGVIQKYKLNWTGFSFHTRCGPMILKDWDYNPTAYWGVYVKDALNGKQFTTERLR